MDYYEIIVTPDAETDLTELRNYIADVLLVPETALTYIRNIRKEISKLAYMAASVAPVLDEPWRSRGIRRIITGNFYVYYRIDSETRRVYVLNIIYSKRDQLRMLSKMNID